MINSSTTLHHEKDAGFTLVELAVVMIIIGLLIGGVLKGQELISNAEITNSASAINTYDSASLSFSDAYGTFPGDVQQASARIPNCNAAPCDTAGGGSALGNQQVADGDAFTAANVERNASFIQLFEADFIGGLDPQQGAVPDGTFPGLEIDNTAGMAMAFSDGTDADLPDKTAAAGNHRRGHYMLVASSPMDAAITAATNGTLEASDTARLDQKLDDGLPNTGDVLALGGTGAGANCATDDGPSGVYQEANDDATCGLYILTSF